MASKRGSEKFACCTVALCYAAIGGLWIFFAEKLFAVLLNQPVASHNALVISHWLFVVFSALILYWLLRYWDLAISHSQESLCSVNRALRCVSECTKAITRTSSEDELMTAVCRAFVENGGYRFAWVGFAGQDAAKSLIPVAKWGYEDDFIASMNATWADTERGRGPAGTTIRTGKTTVFQDFRKNPHYRPWRSKALKCGYASGISLPLRAEEQTFGALVIFSAEVNAFDPEEISLMEELAEDLSYGLSTIRMDAERKKIRAEQTLLAAVIEQTSDGVMTFDANGQVDYVNSAFASLFGLNVVQTVGQRLDDLECFLSNELFFFEIQKTIFSEEERTGRFVYQCDAGRRSEFIAKIAPVFYGNRVAKYVVMVRDVTHEAALEGQLRQAQKMEAIATLAGGVAHDFNNILAVIIANTEMAIEDVGEDPLVRNSLEIVLKAGQRGKTLVKQIRSLSQKNEDQRRPVTIAEIIDECFSLLRASLPTTIELRRKVAPDLGQVAADPTQIHQVVMNLCTNAAEAMANGGCLEISLGEFYLDVEAVALYPGLSTGYYQELRVSDTGTGMSRDVLERIFEPFFTCNKQGKGTGLGLSVVHGIVQSHKGHISTQSRVGEGTVFKVLLPRLDAVDPAALQELENFSDAGGNEQLLFIDDEEDYVMAQRRLLERLGYRVTTATDSREALRLYAENPYLYDLVITDLTMPHLTGDMLAREMLKQRAELPIILCSGSSPETNRLITHAKAKALGISEVLLKPVDRGVLDQTIRRLLNERLQRCQGGRHAEYSYH